MRINRQKKVNRILKFYLNNFGFRKPYQVLVDGTFCNSGLENKINITEQLLKYLGGEVKMVTTPCVILEMEKLGPTLYGAMLILKQFPVHQCGHKIPVFATTCIRSMIENNNKNRYLLATQDRELQTFAKLIPGVPLLYLFNKAPILHVPNELSVEKATQRIQHSCNLSITEKKVIKEMKNEILGTVTRPHRSFKRSKKKGGPNPLSCRKKKKQPASKECGNKKKKVIL